MVKRPWQREMRFESVVVVGIRSEYGTIAGSNPAPSTKSNRKMEIPINTAMAKDIRKTLHQLNKEIQFEKSLPEHIRDKRKLLDNTLMAFQIKTWEKQGFLKV